MSCAIRNDKSFSERHRLMNDPWNQSRLSWWPSLAPFGGNVRFPPPPPIPSGGIRGDFGQENRGILGNLGQSVDEPRTDPWTHPMPWPYATLFANMTPPEKNRPDAASPNWLQMAASQPTNSSKFAPLVEHLDSTKYWGAPTPPVSAESPPQGSQHYLSRIPDGPNWDWMAPPPTTGAAQNYPEPPSTSPWGAPASPIDDDPFTRAAIRTQRSVRPQGGRQEGAPTAVLEHYLPHAAIQLLTLPQRAFEASERFRLTGELDPGPAIETALLTFGARGMRSPFGWAKPAGEFSGRATNHVPDKNASSYDSLVEQQGPPSADSPQVMPSRSMTEPRVARDVNAPEGGTDFTLQGGNRALGSVQGPPISQGRLFDYSRLHEVPQVEQRDLPRYQSEHGVPDHIRALDSPEILDRLDQFARIGLERGGHKAFNIEPLRRHYIAQLGPEKAQAAFKQLTDFMGAVSPVSTDLATLRNASYYDWLAKQGIPLPNPVWDAAKGRPELPKPLPPPYGHFKEGLHAQKVNEVVQQGGLDAIKNPKLGSIAENFSGNLNPIGIDRHIVRALGATDSRGRPIDILPRSGYAFLEPILQQRAAKMGLAPAQYQGAIRAGAAELTGLRSLDPMLVTLRKRIALTAARDRISEVEVLRRFIEHGYPLASIVAVAGTQAVPRQGEGLQAADE
jgi:hypothetical protein